MQILVILAILPKKLLIMTYCTVEFWKTTVMPPLLLSWVVVGFLYKVKILISTLGRHREVLSIVLVYSVIEVEVGCKVWHRILITPSHQVHWPRAVSTSLSVDIKLKMQWSLPPHGIPKVWKIRTLGYQIFRIMNASQSLVYDADLTLYVNFHMYERMYILMCSPFSDHHLKFQMLKI